MEHIKAWPSWSVRKKGVFTTAFAMGLPNPEVWVSAIDLLDIDDKSPADPAHVFLARNSFDITDEQFLSWWRVANTIALRLWSRPTLAQAKEALGQYRAFQKGLSALPIAPWQSLSEPARMAWPVAFLNKISISEIDNPTYIQARARLADEKCLALESQDWEIELSEYSHHARHLFNSKDFKHWLTVENVLVGNTKPIDEEYITQAQMAVDMASSDFS